MSRIKARHAYHLGENGSGACIGCVDLLPVKKLKMRDSIEIKKSDRLILRNIRFEAQHKMFTNEDCVFVYGSLDGNCGLRIGILAGAGNK